MEQGTISKDQYDALQREIIATEHVLEDLEEQAEQSAVALQKIANAGESLKSAWDKVTDVGKKMSVVSAGIVAAGTASTKAALDFEDAMAKVSTIFCFQFHQTCESRFCRSGRCVGYSDHHFECLWHFIAV